MFCFVATDVVIAPDALRAVVRRGVEGTFNRITVDGDQSTSDTVAVLANGVAENAPLAPGARGVATFARALEALMQRLARMLVADGEGATGSSPSPCAGRPAAGTRSLAARSVANSPLVKTAITGQDPNWGRIMMALGKSAARVEQQRVAIAFDDELLVEQGMLRKARASAGFARSWEAGVRDHRRPRPAAGARIACGRATCPRSTCGSTASTRRNHHHARRATSVRAPRGPSARRRQTEEDAWPH